MESKKRPSAWVAFAMGWQRYRTFVIIAVLLLVMACSSQPAVTGVQQDGPEMLAAASPAADAWSALLQNIPFPYSIPLPPPQPSLLDGTYVKAEPILAESVPCMRCPDYAPEAGIWKLNLDKGVYRIYHEATDWRSIGSFTAFFDRTSYQQVNQLVLFNDPHCPGVVGLYNWQLEDGNLTLTVVGDTCSMGLRAANFTHMSWLACRPPSTEAAITDHWPKPPGCD